MFASRILPDAWAGRRLHDALLRHGLVDVRSEIYPVQADAGVLQTVGAMYERFVDSRLMTREQADDHLAEMGRAFEAGSAVYALSTFVASGRVPDTAALPD